MNKNETHEQQVMRILNQMVASGEVVTKKSPSGELLYTLAPKAKCKPAKSKEFKAKRSKAALKAWETRRKQAAAKCKPAKAETATKKSSLSERAKKAWNTRRSKNTACAATCSKAKPTKQKCIKTECTKYTQLPSLLAQIEYVKNTYKEIVDMFQAYEDEIKIALLQEQATR